MQGSVSAHIILVLLQQGMVAEGNDCWSDP